MKKTLIALAAAGLLWTLPASQAITINLTAGILLDENSNVLADGSTLMLIASTGDLDFGNLTSLNLASPTAFPNEGDDVIIARFALDSTIVGVPGAHQQAINFNLGDFGTSANNPLLFVWYSGLLENTSPTAPGYSRHFGTFGFPDDSNWKVPGDNSATIFLSFQTEDAEGPWPNSAGQADQITQAIPEPSTYAMVGLGLLGAVVARRFRKRA
jgi:hypothetical protein